MSHGLTILVSEAETFGPVSAGLRFLFRNQKIICWPNETRGPWTFLFRLKTIVGTTIENITHVLHPTMRHVHRMTQRLNWPLHGQTYPIFVLLISPRPTLSVRFTLRPIIFGWNIILRNMHWMTPKWPSVLQGICVSVAELHSPLRFALRPTVFKIQAILR